MSNLVTTFEVTGMRYTGPPKICYSPSMALLDDNSILVNSAEESLSIDNFMIRPTGNGRFELLLTHSLKETDGHVDKFQVVANWQFESLEHLRDTSQKIFDSVNKQ